MIRFSVVIPTYNRKAYLLACLETVFEQTYAPHEVIVVDDGSEDGTVEVLSRYRPQIQILQQANAGPGAARNQGAKVASGDYIAFLDSDDLWFPWTLATFAELIERHAYPSLVSGRYVDFLTRGELDAIEHKEAEGDAYEDFLASHAKGYSCGAGLMVIARPVFCGTTGFAQDRLNAEDHDLTLKLGIARGFVQVRDPVTLGRRLHDLNEVADIDKTLRGLERLVANEIAGNYPGGPKNRGLRREIIARHVRPAVIRAFRSGHAKAAWSLYRVTFAWNLGLGRVAYLVASPLLALGCRPKPNS